MLGPPQIICVLRFQPAEQQHVRGVEAGVWRREETIRGVRRGVLPGASPRSVLNREEACCSIVWLVIISRTRGTTSCCRSDHWRSSLPSLLGCLSPSLASVKGLRVRTPETVSQCMPMHAALHTASATSPTLLLVLHAVHVFMPRRDSLARVGEVLLQLWFGACHATVACRQ